MPYSVSYSLTSTPLAPFSQLCAEKVPTMEEVQDYLFNKDVPGSKDWVGTSVVGSLYQFRLLQGACAIPFLPHLAVGSTG